MDVHPLKCVHCKQNANANMFPKCTSPPKCVHCKQNENANVIPKCAFSTKYTYHPRYDLHQNALLSQNKGAF